MDDILYKIGVQLSLSAPGMGTAVGLALTQLSGLRNGAAAAEAAVTRLGAAQVAAANAARVKAAADAAGLAAAANARKAAVLGAPLSPLTGKAQTPAEAYAAASTAVKNAEAQAAQTAAMVSAQAASQQAIAATGSAMKGLGVAALGAGVTIAGALGVSAIEKWVKAAAAMQMSMAAVQSVTAGTAQQMQALSDTAMKTSVQTMFSAADVMKIALTAAGKGIVDPSLLNQMLPTLSAQAEIRYRISGSSPADTTAALIQIAHQEGVWGTGKPGSGNAPADFTKMIDTFGAAMTISGMTSSEFQNASKYVIPISKQLGMSIPDTAGLVAILANTGGSGGRGMSGIQTGMTRMIPTVLDHIKNLNRHDKALAALGEESGRGPNPFFDQRGQFIGRAKELGGQGFMGVLKVIMDGLKDASPAQRVSELTTLLGSAGYRVLAPLFTQSAISRYTGTVEPYLTNQGSPKGAAQILYDLNAKTLLGNWTNFQTTLQNISILLGRELLPGIQKLVGWLHDAAAAVQDFALAHPDLAKIVAWFTAIASVGALIVGPLLVIGGALMMIAAAGVTLAPVMGAVGTALFGIGLAALPWLLPVAAGIGLIVLIATHWSQVMHDLTAQWNALGGSQTMKDLGKAFSDLGAALTPLGKKFKDALGPNTKTLVDLLALSLYPVTSSVLAIAKGLTLVLDAATAIATLVAQHPWLGTVLSTGGSAFGFGGGPTIPIDPNAPPAIHPPGPGHWVQTGKYRGQPIREWVPGKGGGAGGGVLWTPGEAAALRAGHGGTSVVIHNHFNGSDHASQEALATVVAEKIGKTLGRTIQYGSPHTSTLSPSLHGV